MRGRSQAVTVRAPAKVNLVLIVGRPREDGFHPLNTVYQAISLYDDVRVARRRRVDASSVEPLGDVDCSGVPLDDSNIALRAGRLLAEHHGLDRAASDRDPQGHPGRRRAGRRQRRRGRDAGRARPAVGPRRPPTTTCSALAAQLGSDVPFALIGGTALGTGRGELVEPVDGPGHLLVGGGPSDDGLSTPAVYREYDRLQPRRARLGWHLEDPADADGGRCAPATPTGSPPAMRNDLQEAALSLRPELRERLDLVEQHRHSTVMLSGSGPTIVGIAKTQRGGARDRGRPARGRATGRCTVATGPVAGAHVVDLA